MRKEKSMFIDDVKRIARIRKDERCRAIMGILQEKDIPFYVQRLLEGEHWVENIVISFAPSNRRLVIGAHYDNLEGSSGANDNASGVSVLIRLAQYISEIGAENVEIVLFDREEYGDHGSSAYIKAIGKDSIDIMINLDMCGYGDAITVLTKGNMGNSLLSRLLTQEMIDEYRILTIDRLPTRFGDDDTFDSFGIPNIAITTMPRNEAILYRDFVQKVFQRIEHAPEEVHAVQSFTYSKTMHNGELDNIEAVSEGTLTTVYSYLMHGIFD